MKVSFGTSPLQINTNYHITNIFLILPVTPAYQIKYMPETTTDRIEIINSFKFLSGSRNKETTSRIKWNYIFGGLMLVLSVLSLGLFLYVMITDFFGFESGLNWNKFTLIVICNIAIADDLFNKVYSLILLKHLQQIEKSNASVAALLNAELETIISKLNKPYKSAPVIFLAVIILVGALLHQFEYNPFWNYFKILLLLFYFLIATDAFQNIKMLKSNIAKSEDQ